MRGPVAATQVVCIGLEGKSADWRGPLHPTACPICRKHEKKSIAGNFDYFNCDTCDGVYIDSRLVRAPSQLDNYDALLGAAREMRDEYEYPATIHFDGSVTCHDENSVEHSIDKFPKTIAEKAVKLLAALIRRTTHFGERITLSNSDYGLAYAKSDMEMRSFVDYLAQQGCITSVDRTMHDITVTVSACALDGATNQESATESRQMRILFLAANPTTTSALDLEEELRSLDMELRGVTHRDRIVFTARHAVRPDDLIRHVRADKPNVIHFSGHGNPNGIILRSDAAGDAEVTGSALGRFLKDRNIDLVVLNSCYSKHQADALKGAVKAVVGTTDVVDDEAARRFTAAFYRALGDGLSIKEAFRDGGDAVALHGLIDVFHSDGDLAVKLVR